MKVSVIICTYNREKFLKSALDSYKNQTLPSGDFEIIVVDNNSTDNTKTIMENFIEENPTLNVRYVFEENQGLSFARNRGIKEAAHEIIVFVDDDAEAENNFLENVKSHFETDENLIAAGGKVEPVFESGKEPQWLSPFLWGLVTKIDYGNKAKPFPKNKYPVGCNMEFRKDVFNKFGMFDTQLGRKGRVGLASEEKDIFERLKAAGAKIMYFPDISIRHHIDNYRLEKSYIIKLCYGIGISEKIRTSKKSFILYIFKLIEFIFKFIASLVIAAGYILKGEFEKAKYVVLFRYHILKGFFKKEYE